MEDIYSLEWQNCGDNISELKELKVFVRPGMGDEVIYWNLNGLSLNDVMECLLDELIVKCICQCN